MEAAVGTESVGVVTAAAILGAFILKAVDLVKSFVQGLRGDWNGFLTIFLTWAVGVAAVWLFTKTAWGDEVKLGDQTLDQLNFSAKLVLGLAAPSVASILYDAKKAVDKTDTASTPRLTPSAEAARQARVAAAMNVPPANVGRGAATD
jgi:hypothetical protein